MITQKAYVFLNKYAKKLAKRPQDADDIVQEACLLLILSPVEGEFLHNNFLKVLLQRGAYHFYMNRYSKEPKNKDILLENENKVFEKIEDTFDIIDTLALKEAKILLYTNPNLNEKQQEYINTIFDFPELNVTQIAEKMNIDRRTYYRLEQAIVKKIS